MTLLRWHRLAEGKRENHCNKVVVFVQETNYKKKVMKSHRPKDRMARKHSGISPEF